VGTPELSFRFEELFSHCPELICVLDGKGCIAAANPSACEAFSLELHELEGRKFCDFVDPDDAPKFDDWFRTPEGPERPAMVIARCLARNRSAARTIEWRCFRGQGSGVLYLMGVDVTDRRMVEAELRESRETVLALFENAAQGILWIDASGRILSFNAMAEMIFGFRREEIVGKQLEVLMPDKFRNQHEGHRRHYFDAPRTRPMGLGMELVGRRKDGSEFPVEISLSHVGTDSGTVAVAFVNDVSERRRSDAERQKLERSLEHATKMEAVGRLAGGIAHDFNNLLTALTGFAEVVLDELPAGHPLSEGAKETLKTCQRSTTLVRRLLAVSRRQMLQPEVIDLNAKVAEIEKMLRSVLGEDIDLRVKLSPDLGSVRADQSQIEQVILNLVVNARDAMPTGGRLVIQTARLDVDEVFEDHYLGLKPGPYVVISVSDTGVGMDQETLAHIFEPFFTTKEKGKGTGLGLATVYGIVSQSGGRIWAYSEPGKGTTFRIYLPRITLKGELETEARPAGPAPRGSETVLVVEDETSVRMVAVGNLRKAGYHVLEAKDGEEALQMAAAHDGPIHLVLTDVLMPGIHGPELVKRLQIDRPSTRVLYMSGHADDALLHHGIHEGGLAFLEKPFTRKELTNKVREILDGG
jgi:PAS domain S-box-containing protein